MRHVTIASYYGPHTAHERVTCDRFLEPLVKECAKVLGDFNVVTKATHKTALRPNSLCTHLQSRQGGPRAAHQSIARFQSTVVYKVTTALDAAIPPPTSSLRDSPA